MKERNDMTLKEYNDKMSEYENRLSELRDDEWNDLYEEMSRFQQKYMKNVLAEYQKTIDSEAKEHIYNLLHYAVKHSQSGSSIEYVDTKEIANAIEEILWEEIGDYLLDYEIYEENNHWVIDCIFAGNYIPYWDGWDEE